MRIFILILMSAILILIGYGVFVVVPKTHPETFDPDNNLQQSAKYDFFEILRGRETGSMTTYFKSGQILEETTIVNSEKHGPGTVYYETGEVRSKVNWKNNRLHGLVERYLDDGTIFSSNNYQNGMLEGINKWYYPNGKLEKELEYRDNKQHGLSKFYSPSGQIENISSYNSGIIHGPVQLFYPNGTLKMEKVAVDGKMTGPYIRYDQNKNVIEEGIFINHKIEGVRNKYYSNGKMKETASFLNHQLQGPSATFFEDGSKIFEGNYWNGQLHGLNKWYYKNGNVRQSSFYEYGNYEGEQFWHFPNGQVEENTSYQSGKLHGTSTFFDETGKFIRQTSYVRGQLDGPYKLYDDQGQILIELLMKEGFPTKIVKDNLSINSNPDVVVKWWRSKNFGPIVRALLITQQFDKLEAIAQAAHQNKQHGHAIFESMFDKIVRNFGAISISTNKKEYMHILDLWAKQYSASLTEHITRIAIQTRLAWNELNDKKKNTRQFKALLKDAERTIKKALLLKEKNPYLYSQWLEVGMGLNDSKYALKNIFKEGQKIDSRCGSLYVQYMISLLPRWGGSKGDVEAFLAESTKSLKESDQNRIKLKVISELWRWEGNDFLSTYTFDRNELLDLYYDSIAQNPNQDDYIKNQYAWLTVHYKKQDLAKTAFQLFSDNRFSKSIWTTEDNYLQKKLWASKGRNSQSSKDIHKSIADGDFLSVYLYTNNKGDLEQKSSQGNTPLFTAIKNKQSDIAEFLMSKGAKLSHKDNAMRTPFHVAVEMNDENLIQSMIALGAAMDTVDKNKVTPLHTAAQNGSVQLVKTILTKHPKLLNVKSNNNRNAFLYACQDTQSNVTEFLLQLRGVDVGVVDNSQHNCMHYAVTNKNMKLIRLLLPLRHNFLDDKNANGETPLDIAIKTNQTDIVRVLKKEFLRREAQKLTPVTATSQ